MVQVIENWTCVTGTVVSVSPEPGDGRLHLKLRIERKEAVKGYPELLHSSPGEIVDIALPPSIKDENALHTGETVTLQVKITRGPKLFAHPDWKPGK